MADDDAGLLDEVTLETLRHIGGSDFVVEVIDAFASETPRRLQKLQAARAVNDVEGVMRAAHALRGSAAQLGAPRLAELAGRVEADARRALEGAAPAPGPSQAVSDTVGVLDEVAERTLVAVLARRGVLSP